MAQFVITGIEIEEKKISQFSSLTIIQGIGAHHTFRLVCPTEAIDGSKGALFSVSKNMVGAPIIIQIVAVGSPGTFQFSGLVTQVEAARFSGHTGDIIISGFSPTILADNAPNCQSWENKNIKAIAQHVLQGFSQNILQTKLNPVYASTLAYTVQYKETDWQFLNRISCAFGEWLFYNGENLVLGAPQGKNAELIFGNNLSQFNIALELQPAKFQMMAYDYISHSVYDGTPSGIATKAGLNDLGKHALQKSEKFYNSQPKQWHNHFLTNKKQLDDFINTRAAMQSSNMVRFKGISDHPGIQVGGSVNIHGKNVFNLADEAFGEYTVISVTHHCDGQGNYSNEFIAIPASIKMPPPTIYADPHCETQSAMVTDNHDPNGLGRVKVKFHWMDGSEKTPWVRVTSPHAGGGKGGFFMPEKGEEVIVGFEGDQAEKPYVIGAVYNGKAKSDFSNAENDLKVIQTRSGHLIKFDDKAGAESITIKDKEENIFKIDTAGGSISISDKVNNKIVIDTAGGSITINDKNNNNMTINSNDNSIGIKALGTITLAAMSINLIAGATVNVQATASYNLNTMNSMSNVSNKTVLRTNDMTNMVAKTMSSSATTINQTAKKDINSKAMEKIVVSAKKKLDQRAGEMDVSTDKGKLRLSAKSNTEIKGKQVKTN